MVRPVKAFEAIVNAVVMELQRSKGAKVRLTMPMRKTVSRKPISALSATMPGRSNSSRTQPVSNNRKHGAEGTGMVEAGSHTLSIG